MNKKMNTVIFIVAGTIVNLVLALLCIGVLLFVVGRFAGALGDKAASLVPFAFVGGVLIAMIVYQKLTRWVIERFDLSDKLSPLFVLKHKKTRRD